MNSRIPVPHLYLRGEVYWFRYTIEGIRKSVTTGKKSKEEAIATASSHILKEWRELSSAYFCKDSALASEVFDRFLHSKSESLRKKLTIRNYTNFIKRFFEFFKKDIILSKITRFQIEDWKNWLLKQKKILHKKKGPSNLSEDTLSLKTVKEHLMFLSSVYKYIGLSSPVHGIELPQKSSAQKKDDLSFFRSDQVLAFLKSAENLVPRVILDHSTSVDCFLLWSIFLFNTGARMGEVQTLSLKSIDKEAGTVKLYSAKVDDYRTIKMFPVVREALEELEKAARKHYGETFTENSFFYFQYNAWYYKWFKKCCKKAGLPILHPHCTRHSFVNKMLKLWQIARIAKYIGHKDINVTYATYGGWIIDSEELENIVW